MPRLRERGDQRGEAFGSIRVVSAFSLRRSTGRTQPFYASSPQRERQGATGFRARYPTSAYSPVAAVRPCRSASDFHRAPF